jgi:hypothetical protein
VSGWNRGFSGWDRVRGWSERVGERGGWGWGWVGLVEVKNGTRHVCADLRIAHAELRIACADLRRKSGACKLKHAL